MARQVRPTQRLHRSGGLPTERLAKGQAQDHGAPPFEYPDKHRGNYLYRNAQVETLSRPAPETSAAHVLWAHLGNSAFSATEVLKDAYTLCKDDVVTCLVLGGPRCVGLVFINADTMKEYQNKRLPTTHSILYKAVRQIQNFQRYTFVGLLASDRSKVINAIKTASHHFLWIACRG